MIRKFFFLLISLIVISCKGSELKTITGKVIYEDKPVFDCEISVFLKEEKDKTTPPIKVVATDENGFFQIKLKEGIYFINARKKMETQGEVLMLVGDIKKIDLRKDVDIGEWKLYSKKDAKIFEKGTGISGVIKNFDDFSKVRVYVYKDDSSGLRGPDYIKESKIRNDGTFTIDIGEGKYYVAVRERQKNIVGPLMENDKSGIYSKNPIVVTKGSYIKLEPIFLNKVNIEKLGGVIKSGITGSDGPILLGQVVKRDGKPAKKIYVLAYENQEMIGKPVSVSPPTDDNGHFKLVLPSEGKYYIGARSKLGGPVEPGELIGTYTGSYDKGIFVKKSMDSKIKIEVNEVW